MVCRDVLVTQEKIFPEEKDLIVDAVSPVGSVVAAGAFGIVVVYFIFQ